MKEFYRKKREQSKKESIITGVVMTFAIHAAAIGVGFAFGMTYLDPPPADREDILIEFEQVENEQVRKKPKVGHRPAIEDPDRTRPEELVAKSEAPVEGHKENLGRETRIGENGDVPVKDHAADTIDKRALFATARNKTDKDTLAAQTAKKISDALKTGHASGNVTEGPTAGAPNYTLKGRTVVGALVKPSYAAKASGTVVVSIKVDGKGNVVEATAGAKGTNVTDKKLWEAAIKAAKATRFTPKMDETPQWGTITYVFKID